MRTVIQRPLKMLNPYTEIPSCGEKKRSVNKGVSSCQDVHAHHEGQHRPPFHYPAVQLEHLKRVNQIEARLNQPVSVLIFIAVP